MNILPQKTHCRGFTLVELMVVTIILGILISIALPNYARSTERAKCSQAIQVLKTMRSAALSYFSDNQTFAGITMQGLENQAGARFFSANDNSDWTFTVAASTATRIQLQALRLSGPHAAAGNFIITLTDDLASNTKEQWSDPGTDYPWDNPGVW
ncbi:MAG: type II secretion system protein [Candidatus Omnitrophota bacterium]